MSDKINNVDSTGQLDAAGKAQASIHKPTSYNFLRGKAERAQAVSIGAASLATAVGSGLNVMGLGGAGQAVAGAGQKFASYTAVNVMGGGYGGGLGGMLGGGVGGGLGGFGAANIGGSGLSNLSAGTGTGTDSLGDTGDTDATNARGEAIGQMATHNEKMIQMQMKVNQVSNVFTAISNIMKAKQDTMQNTLRNMS